MGLGIKKQAQVGTTAPVSYVIVNCIEVKVRYQVEANQGLRDLPVVEEATES